MLATIRKEFLLILRDPGGILLLLIMPAALIIVMAIVQNAPYESYKEMRFDLLVVNNDKGFVGNEIEKSLNESNHFHVISALNNQPINRQQAQALLKSGEYKFALMIPTTATAALVNTANIIANQLAATSGLPATMPTNEHLDSTVLSLMTDPAVKPAMESALQFALNEYTGKIKMEILMKRLAKMNGGLASGSDTSFSFETLMKVLAVEKLSPDTNGQQLTLQSINSVQHNVPAWAIFGMFMIVVPISGNMIRERDEGSSLRIRLIPNALRPVAIGKVIFYMLVCLFQFVCMLLVGIYILPYFGLPSLDLGTNYVALLLIAVGISLSAVGFGYFIGSVFRTANQAMPFGAISVVLFSALGGIWVPTEILPPLMQKVAFVSPLNWCLEGINQIILRQEGIMGILPQFGLLAGFGVLLIFLPLIIRREA